MQKVDGPLSVLSNLKIEPEPSGPRHLPPAYLAKGALNLSRLGTFCTEIREYKADMS